MSNTKKKDIKAPIQFLRSIPFNDNLKYDKPQGILLPCF